MNLRKKRNEQKLTQKEIAEKLNITTQAYANYEQGLREPNITTLKKLADYYQTSLDYLCDYNPPYQLTLPPLTQDQKRAIQILLKLPVEIFYYMLAKLENYQEQYKIEIN